MLSADGDQPSFINEPPLGGSKLYGRGVGGGGYSFLGDGGLSDLDIMLGSQIVGGMMKSQLIGGTSAQAVTIPALAIGLQVDNGFDNQIRNRQSVSFASALDESHMQSVPKVVVDGVVMGSGIVNMDLGKLLGFPPLRYDSAVMVTGDDPNQKECSTVQQPGANGRSFAPVIRGLPNLNSLPEPNLRRREGKTQYHYNSIRVERQVDGGRRDEQVQTGGTLAGRWADVVDEEDLENEGDAGLEKGELIQSTMSTSGGGVPKLGFVEVMGEDAVRPKRDGGLCR
ncbi:hypothetical protein NE237_029942 [Protea cynaroides]|uniref:Uncharacterized protein n=1 Tax=Protea cynaroides TaxID=273540 RepID=A0A9Q0GV74_9MAGN|nr:hypothetical protein NE237_029942 [Protea cynaroides]